MESEVLMAQTARAPVKPDLNEEEEWRRKGQELLVFIEKFREETDLEELDIEGFLADVRAARAEAGA